MVAQLESTASDQELQLGNSKADAGRIQEECKRTQQTLVQAHQVSEGADVARAGGMSRPKPRELGQEGIDAIKGGSSVLWGWVALTHSFGRE